MAVVLRGRNDNNVFGADMESNTKVKVTEKVNENTLVKSNIISNLSELVKHNIVNDITSLLNIPKGLFEYVNNVNSVENIIDKNSTLYKLVMYKRNTSLFRFEFYVSEALLIYVYLNNIKDSSVKFLVDVDNSQFLGCTNILNPKLEFRNDTDKLRVLDTINDVILVEKFNDKDYEYKIIKEIDIEEVDSDIIFNKFSCYVYNKFTYFSDIKFSLIEKDI